jgi:hypothetical protein
VAQVVDYLSSKHKALSSNPNTTKKKRVGEREGRNVFWGLGAGAGKHVQLPSSLFPTTHSGIETRPEGTSKKKKKRRKEKTLSY